MWEMCYVYYMTNATAITEDGVPLYFGFNTGNAALDTQNQFKLRCIGLDTPNGKMRFWYVSTEEAICYAFPKKVTDPFGFTDKDVDGELMKYELAIDNDGKLYLYSNGSVRELY